MDVEGSKNGHHDFEEFAETVKSRIISEDLMLRGSLAVSGVSGTPSN